MAKNDIYSQEAEESVIGSLLIDPDAILFVQEIIGAADFYIRRLGWIYQAVLDLHRRNVPADMVTLADELNRRRQLDEIGGVAYLTDLTTRTPTSIHAAYYAGIVKRASTMRRLEKAAGQIAVIAHTDSIESDEAVQQASKVVLDVATGALTSKPKSVGHYAGVVYDDVEKAQKGIETGIPTGLTDLTRMLRGLRGGKLYLMAGRPGMGKSSLALQSAVANAKEGKTVLYFSREMPGEELTGRVISAETGIDSDRLAVGQLKNDEWGRFYGAIEAVESWPLLIDDRTSTIEGIKARSVVQASQGLDLIIVDYIQRIKGMGVGRNATRDEDIGSISEELKNLAIDLRVPVVAISSLSRKVESRHDKRPMLSDLRESGSLEYDADTVIFLYRDEIYNPDTEWPGVAELIIGKNRGGPVGVMSAFFRKHLTQFVDLEVRTEKLVTE